VGSETVRCASVLVAALSVSCGEESPSLRTDRVATGAHQDVIDVTQLEREQHPAAKDLLAVIKTQTHMLARCADPVRPLVRQRRNEIGFGRVGVTVDAVAERGEQLWLRTLDVEPVFASQPEFATCIRSTLSGAIPVVASADYTLHVRLHLCVQPERPNVDGGART
jgi:hypothetical protein